jgi:putative peptide zinc metalloprotease protein
MSAPLLSNSWYRVAALKPELRAHARLHRHRYRGEVWYLLQDPGSNRVHRFAAGARLIIASMDGVRTVEDLWVLANKRLGEHAPTQDEVINLLGQLHAADLLQSNVTPDASEVFDRGARQERSSRRRSFSNPMAIRVHLWDPDAFLRRINPLIQWLWSPWGTLLWMVVVVPALILLPPHWSELTSNLSDRVLAANNLLLLWLVFPIIKTLHELGHATATKAGGGEVHDMGVMMLVLVPVPYVEASASSTFKSKYARAAVGGAGMLVELFIAAIAFYLWLLIEPGMGRAILFNVMLVAGVSTLVFNGNPLLRYDAYYILADLIEMPNLAQRSLRFWGYAAKRYLFGMDEADRPETSASERAWLLFYGVGSTVYRILVTIAIALFIASEFFVIGVVLAIWALVAMAMVPLIKGVRQVIGTAGIQRYRRRVMAVSVGIVAALILVFFVFPMPYRSNAEGVVWLSEQAMVRAGANGFVSEIPIAPGTAVVKGDILVNSYDPALTAQLRIGEAKVAELQANYTAQFAVDRARANIALDQLESEKAALERLRDKAGALTVRAATDGVLVVPRASDLPGRYFRKGDLVGYVIEKGRPLVRVVVSQDTVDMVRLATNGVSVRHVYRPEIVAEGRIVRQVPAGEEHLPSKALAADGGGKISTDPRDQKGTKALERMFQFDIEMVGHPDAAYFGDRVYVRFDHVKAPLALQWYRDLRLLFLSRFNV